MDFITRGSDEYLSISSKIMPGNVDGYKVEGTTVDIQAAYLRFTPKRFKNNICMRVELYGCKSSEINDFIPEKFYFCTVKLFFIEYLSFFYLPRSLKTQNLNPAHNKYAHVINFPILN